MTVTIRLDDTLRQKPYWQKVKEGQPFEYLRDRPGSPGSDVEIAMLKDAKGNLVSCDKSKVVFPDPVIALIEEVLSVPETREGISE
jgi:hypothetical protein